MIKNKKGSIIYISSSSALDGNSGRSAYSSSKSALLTQAKTLSNELGVYNIRVNIICYSIQLAVLIPIIKISIKFIIELKRNVFSVMRGKLESEIFYSVVMEEFLEC